MNPPAVGGMVSGGHILHRTKKQPLRAESLASTNGHKRKGGSYSCVHISPRAGRQIYRIFRLLEMTQVSIRKLNHRNIELQSYMVCELSVEIWKWKVHNRPYLLQDFGGVFDCETSVGISGGGNHLRGKRRF